MPFEETTAEPPPEPPKEKPKPRRVVQGLSASSFAEGSGTGMSVRAGTSTMTKAGKETLEIDQATEFSNVPYASVTTPPRMRAVPEITVPQEAIDNEIEGTWTVVLDVDPSGRVVRARMAKAVGYGIDEACVAAWRASRWKPGKKDGVPVGVTGIPKKCSIKAVD